MSGNDASLETKAIVAAGIASKEAQVLAELSETLNTLCSLQEVLKDIVVLTEPVNAGVDGSGEGSDSSSGRTSVSLQIHRLLSELQKWEETTNEDI